MATIGIDLDGVCYDFVGAVCDLAGMDRPSCESWEFYEEWGWDREKFLEVCREGLSSRGTLFGYGYVIPGAKEGVHALLDAGHKVVFVTARGGFSGGKETREATQRRTLHWLKTEMRIPNPVVVFDGRKATVAAQHGITFFLEDNAPNVERLRHAGVLAYLFDQPWNRCFLTMRRVYTWDQFVEYLEGMGREIPVLDAPSTGEVRTVSESGGEKGVKPERYDLLPKPALDALSRVYAYGATKYDDHNWRRGYEWSKSYAAAQRHLTAFWDGETNDPESGLPHVAHAMFHMAALLTWLEGDGEGGQYDDRYRAKGDAA